MSFPGFPALPQRAAYVILNNAAKRNALSLAVLKDLKQQLEDKLTSPVDGQIRVLPPFDPLLLDDMENNAEKYRWLTDASTWRKHREDLPNVIVLRSEGPVFSSGHDLKELSTLSHDDVTETFRLCAELMSLIRHSPAPVVCPIQGLATAAGFQLAITADYPIALANTTFRLPGASIGLPCTSPVTAVSRRMGNGIAYRLLATAETMTAAEINQQGTIDVVPTSQWNEATDVDKKAFDERVNDVVTRLAVETAGQPQALGKWAYWTQIGITKGGGDGYEEAAKWAGRVMALHAKAEDAKHGMQAFLHKRPAEWST